MVLFCYYIKQYFNLTLDFFSQTICLICSEISSTANSFQLRPDRGGRNDMQHLSTDCLECDWTGTLELYQVYHIDKLFTID